MIYTDCLCYIQEGKLDDTDQDTIMFYYGFEDIFNYLRSIWLNTSNRICNIAIRKLEFIYIYIAFFIYIIHIFEDM